MAEIKQNPDDQLPQKRTDLSLPQKSPFTRIAIAGADIGSYSLRLIRYTCRGIASCIRDKIEAIIKNGEETEYPPTKNPIKYIRNATKRAICRTVKFSRDTGRNLRWINKINIHAAPVLLDEHSEDLMLKSDIVDDLESRIGVAAPFIEEIERIGKACFDRGIPAERLIAFLESKDVLNFLINVVLEKSRYRGSNLESMIVSAIDALIYRLENFADKKRRKRKVNQETETNLMKKLKYFQANYDPRSKKYTISRFIKELETQYAGYDIISWIKKHKALFIELIRGRAEEKYNEDNPPPDETRHVANIVNDVYQARGQLEPAKFIESNFDRFFSEYNSADVQNAPAFLRKIAGIKDQEYQTICVIDLDELKLFFDEKLQKLQNHNLNLLQLRGELIDACSRKINGINLLPAVLIFSNQSGVSEICSDSDKNILIEAVTGKIRETCQFVSSHVDVKNLLFDPIGIPPEMEKNYEEWFDDDRELNQTAYRRYLRGIFGHTTVTREGETKDEQFNRLKIRATAIFEQVNEYLVSVSAGLGIPPITVDSVQEVNDYAELVKIVCTTKDPRERFAARRKIELAALMYTCMITPRYVYREYEAKATKAALEHSSRGIDYQSDRHDAVWFVDNPDAQPAKVELKDLVKLPDKTPVQQISLIPVKFGGEIKCHLTPTSADDEFEYMAQKSLFSMLTNLLNEDNKRAKDMTDILRMTFVVDSIEDLAALQKYLETNYISFGRSLKRENRYGKLVDVSSTVATAENGAKSQDYHTLRYVVDISVPDENDRTKTYAVPEEMRILLIEDLIKERSAHHPASHKRYEERRLQQVIKRKLAPEIIFPEFYKQVGPDPDDVFKATDTTIKDRTDYQIAA